jgi:hypothetical protein
MIGLAGMSGARRDDDDTLNIPVPELSLEDEDARVVELELV